MPTVLRGAGAIITVLLANSIILGQGTSWANLGHVSRSNVYTFILRNKTCLQGRIDSVHPDSLNLAMPNTASKPPTNYVTVNRSDVLQIKDGSAGNDVVYNGRSSWRDVESVPAHAREYLSIRLQSGKLVTGKPVSSTDYELSLKRLNGVKTVQKADISLVYYIRIKPTPAGLEWYVQEAGPLAGLNPQTWPYIFNLGVQMSVLLYNSALAEDNSTLRCPTGP
jgi:hypothetical protein